MTRAVFGRIFLMAVLLVGAAAVALFATRTGYNIAEAVDPATGAVTCTYWVGFGLHRTEQEPGTACAPLLRDIEF